MSRTLPGARVQTLQLDFQGFAKQEASPGSTCVCIKKQRRRSYSLEGWERVLIRRKEPTAAPCVRRRSTCIRRCSSGACLSHSRLVLSGRTAAVLTVVPCPLQTAARLQADLPGHCSCVSGPRKGLCPSRLLTATPSGPTCRPWMEQPDFPALALCKPSLGCGGVSVGSVLRGRGRAGNSAWRVREGLCGGSPNMEPHSTESCRPGLQVARGAGVGRVASRRDNGSLGWG